MTEPVVFSFSWAELNQAIQRLRDDERQQATELLEHRFSEWEADKAKNIALQASIVATIITSTGETNKLIEWADKVGTTLRFRGLSRSQIYGIFGAVRRIEMGWSAKKASNEQEQKVLDDQKQKALTALLLLKPKLAYQGKKVPIVGHLEKVLKEAIDSVKDRDDFQRFVDFFEAILAYHTAAGGK